MQPAGVSRPPPAAQSGAGQGGEAEDIQLQDQHTPAFFLQ